MKNWIRWQITGPKKHDWLKLHKQYSRKTSRFFFSPHSHFSTKWQERKLFGQTTKWIHRISQADTSLGPYMMPTEVSRSPGYHPSMGGWGCWEVGSTAQGAGRGLARGLVQPPTAVMQGIVWPLCTPRYQVRAVWATHRSLASTPSIQVSWGDPENSRKS